MKIIDQKDINSIQNAAEVLKSGGILVFPTDTVYGIGCALNETAIIKLYQIKNRPLTQPTAILMNKSDVPELLLKEFKKYPAGCVTIIADVEKYSNKFPQILLKDGKIGVRIPSDAWLEKLISKAGPIVASSANLAGENMPKKYSDISSKLFEQVDLAIKSDIISLHSASTVYDIEEEKIIRK